MEVRESGAGDIELGISLAESSQSGSDTGSLNTTQPIIPKRSTKLGAVEESVSDPK
jgi:hypothetical protein